VKRLALWLVAGIIGIPFALILLFRFVDPPVSALMLIRWTRNHEINMRWRAYDDLPISLREAVIASEDLEFCAERLGFDWIRMRHQIGVWWRGGRPNGASTITMQLARNLFLWPERSLVRKIIEAWLTPQIALLWPKRRQLEIYLNIVEFGPGVYGADAASRLWFNTSADTLTTQQAAQLVAILPAPLLLSPTALTSEAEQKSAYIQAFIARTDPRLGCVDRM
jgi:monofunctional biosynthetic peptidoglycan transglycosylase